MGNKQKKFTLERSYNDQTMESLYSFATAHVRKGTNLRVVQEMLGHSDLKMTSVYVSLAQELMNKEIQRL